MPDVAVMIGLPMGQASFTVAPVAGDTVTRASAKGYVIGPPVNGAAKMAAQYILQLASTDTGQTANTYRWVADIQFNGAAPTTWSYVGDGFVSLGGV